MHDKILISAAPAGTDGEEPSVSAQRFHNAQLLVSDARSKFYDRVALLSGGSVVLSISFLSAIASKSIVHTIASLFCAWLFFLGSLLCCIFRNPPFHKYLLHSYAFYFAKSLLKKKQMQLASIRNAGAQIISQKYQDGLTEYESDEEIQKDVLFWDKKKARLLKKALKFHRHSRILEIAALTFFFSGLVLLSEFAVVNALVNPHQMFK